jgi:hypothetical protein
MSGSPEDHYCIRSSDFSRIERLIGEVFTKMDSFITDMRDIMVEDARKQERVATLTRDMADAKAELLRLTTWKNQFAGSVRALVAVPSACAFLVTLIHLYGFLRP